MFRQALMAIVLAIPFTSGAAAQGEGRFPDIPAEFLVDSQNKLLLVALDPDDPELHRLEQQFHLKDQLAVERRQDYAVALMAVGRTAEAREQLALAHRDTGGEIDWSLRLLDVFVALRERAFGEAAARVEVACPHDQSGPLVLICAHVRAQVFSLLGDRVRSTDAMRQLRRTGERIQFPDEFIPREVRYDAVRAAHYAVLVALNKPLWDTYGQEWQRANLRKNLIQMYDLTSAEDSGQAIDRLMKAVEWESSVGNYQAVLNWIQEYDVLAIANRWQQPIDRFCFSGRALFAQGKMAEAHAQLDELKQSINEMVEEPYSRYEILIGLLRNCIPHGFEALTTPYLRETWAAMSRATDVPSRLVAFEAGIQLMQDAIYTSDLKQFEQLRGEMVPLAAELERRVPDQWAGKRFFNAWVELRVAEGILFHDPRPERLAEAAKRLTSALTDVKKWGDLARDGRSKYVELSSLENEQNEIVNRTQRLQLAAYRIQEAAAPILGHIFMQMKRWNDAVPPLELAHDLTMKVSVCGEPVEQVAIATDLFKVALAREAKEDARSWGEDAHICGRLSNNRSPQYAWLLTQDARDYEKEGNLYAAEYALARAEWIQTSLERPLDRELAHYLQQHTELLNAQGDAAYAMDLMQSAAQIVEGIARTEWSDSELTITERQVALYSKIIAAESDENRRNALLEQAFTLSQTWLLNEAGQAVEAMARRKQIKNEKLIALVQHRDELIQERDIRDRAFGQFIGTVASVEALDTQKELAERISNLNQKIKDLSMKIGAEQTITAPRPLSLSEVRSLLGEDEFLFYFVYGKQDVMRWTVSRTGADLKRLDVDPDKLALDIARLRCGLDASSWVSDIQSGMAICADLPPKAVDPGGEVDVLTLPFDVIGAYSLYSLLFPPLHDAALGTQTLPAATVSQSAAWIVVPSGPLSQLSYAVLASDRPPSNSNPPQIYGDTEWLGTQRALSLLPSISSLQSLRHTASKAKELYIGFGNPLLPGKLFDPSWAELSKSWSSCKMRDQNACSLILPRAHTLSGDSSQQSYLNFRPLPQTVCELCAIAGALNIDQVAAEEIIHLGSRMTKADVERLGKPDPTTGRSELQNYRIIHFATHGVMAGQITGIDEPGLIMSPPAASPGHKPPEDAPGGASTARERDGVLTSGEIAELKLDADWVILSACNTAASRNRGGEAFSGLARAFLYAGAKSVLISNWSVSTTAAVKISTSALRFSANSRNETRAQALRDAVTAVLDEGRQELRILPTSVKLHPAYWGPFALIGDAR